MTAASKRVVSGMETLAKECDRTACSLACELIDKLTVIVGNRDLLREEMEAGSADSKRLDLIRGMAKDRQWIKRVSMPTTGGGPKRRRAEALRRLNNVSAPA